MCLLQILVFDFVRREIGYRSWTGVQTDRQHGALMILSFTEFIAYKIYLRV